MVYEEGEEHHRKMLRLLERGERYWVTREASAK